MDTMIRYPKYKYSGVEWIGEIPEHWDTIRLKFLTINYDSKRIPLRSDDRGTKNGNYPYYGATGIIDFINEYIFEGKYVLVGEDGAPFFIENRDVSFVANGKFWVNNHAHILQCLAGQIPEILSHQLNLVDYRKYITGSTRDKLTQTDLNDIIVIDIPKQEQTIITNYLDEETAQIDRLIAKKQRLIDLLKEERTAVINNAVTKGINPDVKLKPSGVEWLGDIPEHWEVKKLKYIANINLNSLSEKEDDDLLITYIDIGSVDPDGNIIETVEYLYANAPSRARRIVNTGDTILSTVRTYLKAIAFIDETRNNFICSTGFAVIEPSVGFIPKYLFYLLRSQIIIENIMAMSKGVSYPAIDSENVKNILIWYATKEEQLKIVQHIEIQMRKIYDTIAKIEKEIELMQEYRTALIREVVTGKVKVA